MIPSLEQVELRRHQIVAVVARHELGRLWRSGAFWSSTVLTALILCIVVAVPALATGDESPLPAVGLVGEQAELSAVLADHAEVEHYADRAQARAALRDGEVDAVLLPDDEVLVERVLSEDLARLLRWAQVVAAAHMAAGGEAGTPEPSELRVTALEADVDRLQQRTLAAGGGVLVLALLMLLFGSAIAHNVAEEKSSRIVELLLAKARPWQLLTGKILGVSTAAVGPVLAIMVAVAAVASVAGVFAAPVEILGVGANLLLWFIPAFVLFTTVYAVAGALVSAPEDVGHVTGPVMLVQMLCLVGPLLVVSGANQLLIAVVSVVPGLSWATMPVRMAYDGVPWWQVGAGYLLMLLSIVALVRIGARVYRGGLLQHGGVVKITDALAGARAQGSEWQGERG